MSVFPRKNKEGKTTSWEFDFRIVDANGGRHRASGAGYATKAAAEEAERQERARITRAVEAARHYQDSLKFVDCCDKYYEEHGQFQKAADDTKRDLARLVRFFDKLAGEHVLITEITDAHITKLVAWRRGHTVKSTDRPISNAGVNRSTTEVLKKVFVHARNKWRVRFDLWPNWQEHMLPEDDERHRPFYQHEAEALAKVLAEERDDYLPAIQFAMAAGLRRSEIVKLEWDKHIKFPERLIMVRGKGDKLVGKPMTQEMFDILWPLQGHHARVFTYVARARGPRRSSAGRAHRREHFVPQAAKAGQLVGQRYPITDEGFKTVWRRVKAKAGIASGRDGLHFHDLRHVFGGDLQRASGGNPRITQRGLAHADYESTMRYTHADLDEVRAAMERASERRRDHPLFKTTVKTTVKAVVAGGKPLE